MIAGRGGLAYGIVAGLIERGIFPAQVAGMGTTTAGIRGWVLRTLAGGAGELAEEEAQMLLMGATRMVSGLDPDITVEKAVRTRKDPDSMIEQVVDLGFVGEPSDVDPTLIQALINAPEDYIPVIAPIGVAEDGKTYNINADDAATAVARRLGAQKLVFLTDVPGLLRDVERVQRHREGAQLPVRAGRL